MFVKLCSHIPHFCDNLLHFFTASFFCYSFCLHYKH
jgi:hypothetical protein